jgi:hypothetical protein
MLKPDGWDDKAGRWDAGGWVATLNNDDREYMVEEIG